MLLFVLIFPLLHGSGAEPDRSCYLQQPPKQPLKADSHDEKVVVSADVNLGGSTGCLGSGPLVSFSNDPSEPHQFLLGTIPVYVETLVLDLVGSIQSFETSLCNPVALSNNLLLPRASCTDAILGNPGFNFLIILYFGRPAGSDATPKIRAYTGEDIHLTQHDVRSMQLELTQFSAAFDVDFSTLVPDGERYVWGSRGPQDDLPPGTQTHDIARQDAMGFRLVLREGSASSFRIFGLKFCAGETCPAVFRSSDCGTTEGTTTFFTTSFASASASNLNTFFGAGVGTTPALYCAANPSFAMNGSSVTGFVRADPSGTSTPVAEYCMRVPPGAIPKTVCINNGVLGGLGTLQPTSTAICYDTQCKTCTSAYGNAAACEGWVPGSTFCVASPTGATFETSSIQWQCDRGQCGAAPIPEGWEKKCASCQCTHLSPEIPQSGTLTRCAEQCGAAQMPAFQYNFASDGCRCCTSNETGSGVKKSTDSGDEEVYTANISSLPPAPAGFSRECQECVCGGTSVSGVREISDCGSKCQQLDQQDVGFGPSFSFDPNAQRCHCCRSPVELVPRLGIPSGVFSPDLGAGVEGDPHVRTLDGRHYLLLSQGTFSLWRFSGTYLASKDSSTKLEVDWQAYAHYSGHLSYTKSLLLVDKTGGRLRQALEITAQDCQWRSKTSNGAWSKVEGVEMVSMKEGNALATGFRVNPQKSRNHVALLMNDNGMKEIAVLSISCRPGHFMNVAMKMKHSSDLRFVTGELRAGRNNTKASSMLQMTDEEFAVTTPWQRLGGSDAAASYLEAVDSMDLGSNFLSCNDEKKAEQLCLKHLGDLRTATSAETDLFNDCVFDVCRGGEVDAELAAELLAVTRAIAGT